MKIKSGYSFSIGRDIIRDQKDTSTEVIKIKVCKNCGDNLSNTQSYHQMCSEACRQEIKIKLQVSSMVYTNLISL